MLTTTDDHQSSDEQGDGSVRLSVEFRQTFTVELPSEIGTEHAEDRFHSVSKKSLRTVLSAREGEYEIIGINGPEGDE